MITWPHVEIMDLHWPVATYKQLANYTVPHMLCTCFQGNHTQRLGLLMQNLLFYLFIYFGAHGTCLVFWKSGPCFSNHAGKCRRGIRAWLPYVPLCVAQQQRTAAFTSLLWISLALWHPPFIKPEHRGVSGSWLLQCCTLVKSGSLKSVQGCYSWTH